MTKSWWKILNVRHYQLILQTKFFFLDVILKLLAHSSEEIKEEVYRLCQKRVIAAIGPKLNTSGSGITSSQILFLCRFKIFVEIGCHGMTSDNSQVNQ